MEWDEEQEQLARSKVENNSEICISEDQIQKFEEEADEFWNKFYDIHNNRLID